MDNMKKYAFYMPKSLIDNVDNTINSLGKMSRAEFIREAVDFYISYLNSLKASDYLSPMLSRAIKSEIESVEKNVSEMIFKLAVQSAVANIFIASGLNLDTSNIDYLTKCAAREIAKQNGIIDLKKASEMFGVE